MYGWRARLGLVVPTNNTTVEPDFSAMAPEGVACFASRSWVHDVEDREAKVESVLALRDGVVDAARQLVDLRPAVIGFCCTSGSFLAGVSADEQMCRDMVEATGIASVTTSSAVTTALHALGVQRLTMVGPYIEESGSRGRDYLEAAGFDVVSRRNLEILHNVDKGLLPPSESYRLARRAVVDGAQAVVIPGTNWRAIESIAALEEDLGVPVVTSNQATMWLMLNIAGTRPDARWGQLMERPLAASEIPAAMLPVAERRAAG